MPVDALTIIDTSVKIGLGAVISGISTYILAKSNHNKEIEKEKLKRNREMLEQISEQVELFCSSALKYWAYMIEYVRRKENAELTNETDFNYSSKLWDQPLDERRKIAFEEVFANYQKLSNAEAKLMLLGHSKCQKKIRDLGEYGNSLFRHKWDNLTKKQAKEYRANLLSKREEVFTLLQQIYK